jgi:hypothetical protein
MKRSHTLLYKNMLTLESRDKINSLIYLFICNTVQIMKFQKTKYYNLCVNLCFFLFIDIFTIQKKKQKCPYILCLNLCLCLLKFTDVNFPYIYTVLKKVVLFNLLIFTINKELISYVNPKIEWQTK